MDQPKRTRKEIRGAVIGMVLGDGSLYRNRLRDGRPCGRYKLSISHSLRQREYLAHKTGIVQPLFDYELPIVAELHTAEKGGKTYPCFRMATRVHPRFSFVAKRIFVDGEKRITQWALDNITLEGLALWWMDDGCLHRSKRDGGGALIWGAYDFPKEDLELFQRWLHEKFGVAFSLLQHSKGGWYLRRGLSACIPLLEAMSPFSAPGMGYKFEYHSAFKRCGPYHLSTELLTASSPAQGG